MTDESTAIVERPSAGIVRVAGNVIEAFKDYQELQRGLDAAMPDALMEIRGRKFRKKAYWRAVARAFNLSVEQVSEVSIGDATDTSTYKWGFSAVYRATAPNGAHADGDGTCMAAEKYSAKYHSWEQATPHNVRSHAHTRAFNRAVSNLVGFGEVSAEEAEKDEHGPAEPGSHDGPPPAKKSSPAPSGDVWQGVLKDTKVINGVSKASGNPYTKYLLITPDGLEISTFDRKHYDAAKDARTSPVVIKFNKTKFGLEVDFIGPAE